MFSREEAECIAGVEELRYGCGDWWRTNKCKSGRGRVKMSATTNERRERRTYVVSSAPSYCRCDSLLRSKLPLSDELHEPSPLAFAAKLNTGCSRESIPSLSSTSEGMLGSEKSNAQGLSGDSCFPGGEVYSRAAGFRAHFLGPTAVDVAPDHGAEGVICGRWRRAR